MPYLDRWLADAGVAATAVAGAPAVDALVRPPSALTMTLTPVARPEIDPLTGDARGRAMATASSKGVPGAVDPLPVALLLLPAAWFARHGLRELQRRRAGR